MANPHNMAYSLRVCEEFESEILHVPNQQNQDISRGESDGETHFVQSDVHVCLAEIPFWNVAFTPKTLYTPSAIFSNTRHTSVTVMMSHAVRGHFTAFMCLASHHARRGSPGRKYQNLLAKWLKLFKY